MRITKKGQVTIPKAVRERHGLLPGTEVEFRDDGRAVRLRKPIGARLRGHGLVEHLRKRAAATTSLSTDEIMALTRSDD